MPLLLRTGLAVLLLAAIAVTVAYFAWSASISVEEERLRAAAAESSGRPITAAQIAALPAAAARYFTRAGVIGTVIPRRIRLEQRGRIRSGAETGWMTLEAAEVYSTNPPAFLWRTGMPSLLLPVVLGRDAYLDGQGSIAMKLLSLIPVPRRAARHSAPRG